MFIETCHKVLCDLEQLIYTIVRDIVFSLLTCTDHKLVSNLDTCKLSRISHSKVQPTTNQDQSTLNIEGKSQVKM
jgi:hypothetical protein